MARLPFSKSSSKSKPGPKSSTIPPQSPPASFGPKGPRSVAGSNPVYSTHQLRSTNSNVSMEIDELNGSNSVGYVNGRRLQGLQSSLQNPGLSPAVRALLTATYKQLAQESALEPLPPYTMEAMPPAYQV